MPMGNRLAAEFLGTFWLVFGGCGSAVLAAAFPDVGIGLLGVALAFGLTLVTLAHSICLIFLGLSYYFDRSRALLCGDGGRGGGGGRVKFFVVFFFFFFFFFGFDAQPRSGRLRAAGDRPGA